MSRCKACGGTGDEFDREKNDWAWPWRQCPECGGTGEEQDEDEDFEFRGRW